MFTEFLILVACTLLFLYWYLTNEYDYWKKRGVKYVEPHFILGSFYDLIFFRKSRPDFHREIYDAGKGEPYIGIIQTRAPALYIRDPELLRHVMTKDFSNFHDRGMTFDEKQDRLSGHLFNLEGAQWRSVRQKLTPVFTSGKMKNMLLLMEKCADEMLALLDPLAEHEEVIEMKEIMARFTTDIIGTCAFGVECNSLRNPDAEFRKMGALLFSPNIFTTLFQFVSLGFPSLSKKLPLPPVFRKVTDFFFHAIRDTVKYREENNVERKDLLDLLIQIRKKGTIAFAKESSDELKHDAFIEDTAQTKVENFEFTENLMASQAFIFFIAGFETSSSTLSYALIEISRNPEIQEKLQKEIDATFERHGNKFTYDGLMEMSYLDKVVSETLRMYPPVPLLIRQVTEPYKVPNSDLVLEKDLRIFIPIHAIQHDPDIYPNPETFDPERFSEEEKLKRHKYAYLPFGEGPRNCIGMRFGLLQTKLGLATLLHNFRFELSPQTPYPLTFSMYAFFLDTDYGTYLRIKKRALRN